MKNLYSRRLMTFPFMILALLASLACVTLFGGGSPAEGSPAKIELGTGTLIFPETNAGLADLSSYRAALTISFDGSEAGQAKQWSRTYVMLFTKEPAARQLTIEKTGAVSDPDPVFLAEIDGAAYERRGENGCTATVIDDGNSLTDDFEPAGFVIPIIGADEAGSETVNDIAAGHYTFDERAIAESGVTESTGELWIASEGGFIVKYILSTTADEEYFGEGIEGTLTRDYELTEVNAPVTFSLPADCPAGLVDAPLLPDATNIHNVPGVLSYETPTGLDAAAAFYQEQIPELGWTLSDEPGIAGSTAILDYSLEDQHMTIIITTEEGLTTVNILLEHSQE